MSKPPTQYAGVVGIEPKPIVLTPEPPQHVNWEAVASLPPFQMYVVERFGRTGRDSHEWAIECAVHSAAKMGDKAVMDDYAAWHADKGYWPGEDHLGRSR
jgi:hypothetical protein